MANPIVAFFTANIGKENYQGPSSAGNWLNGVFTEAAEGMISKRFEVRPEMLNPGQTLHGGIIALMLDEIIGIACFSLHREFIYTTVSLNVNYLKPARVGETVIGKAQVLRPGNQIVAMEAELYNQEGKLLAKASSNMVRTPQRNLFYQGSKEP